MRINLKIKWKSVIEKKQLEFSKNFPIERILAEQYFKIFEDIGLKTQKSRKWGFSFSQRYFFILKTAMVFQRMTRYRE